MYTCVGLDEQIPAVSLTCSNSSSVVSPESRTFTSFHNAPMAEVGYLFVYLTDFLLPLIEFVGINNDLYSYCTCSLTVTAKYFKQQQFFQS